MLYVTRVLRAIRIGGSGLARVERIAGAMAGDGDPKGQFSAAVRLLIGEALTVREKACKVDHRGPIVDQACGYCGREVS